MKNKIRILLVVLALQAGVHSTSAQPALGISPAGGQSIIYWPTSSTNYTLQTTTNLATPNWLTANNAVTVNAVVVTNSAASGYFRLLAQTNTTAGMVLIPAGSFLMGNYLFYNSATNDSDIPDAHPTNVYVSAFYMDANLVSYGQWQAVYNWATNNGYGFTNAGSGRGNNYPAVTVDWFDCVKWCNARSQQAGLTPAYYTDAGFTQVFTNGDDGTTVYLNLTNNGYRLPTEAEWEKAARGGLAGQRFPRGNSISESQANYDANPAGFSYDLGPYTGFNTNFYAGFNQNSTSPSGSFAPNGCSTWQETCRSGAGIGMGCRMDSPPRTTRPDRLVPARYHPAVYCAAAIISTAQILCAAPCGFSISRNTPTSRPAFGV
jgi:formylglycine-generating enzyme required for sulfatase activity